jgi:hypothetical protein
MPTEAPEQATGDAVSSHPAGTPHPASERAQEVRERQQSQVRAEASDGEPREGRDLIDAAARSASGRGEKLSQEEVEDATEWFLSDESEDLTDDIQLNVGTRRKPKWITWVIRSVDLDELRRIRRQSRSQNRRARITGQADFDGDRANLQIVLRGTVAPDLHGAAKQMGLVDPADALRKRFRAKPGLIDQIAGEIMSLSGYDEDDVREADAARG